jgi:hypothetical protein
LIEAESAARRSDILRRRLARSVIALLASAILMAPMVALTPSTPAAAADRVALVDWGSDWRWRYEHGSWPTGWRSPGFDASHWQGGTAPLGWGRYVATTVTYDGDAPRGPLAILFRTTFTVTDPDSVTGLVLSVLADDGVSVFVNGTEVGRQNLSASGQVSHTSYATAAPNGERTRQPVSFAVPASALRSGTNTITASTHVNWRATPTVSFDASLTGYASDGSGGGSGGEVCGPQAYLAPECGALWGIYTTRNGTLTTAVTNLEAQVGRSFDIVLRYHDFSDHVHQGLFPDSHQVTLGQDRILLFAWQARVAKTDADISWSEIARGRWDRYIDAAAARIDDYGRPVMVAFDPEFDRFDKGTMADYVNAYRRIHSRFESLGVDNVAWLWVPTGYLGAGNDERTMQGYPGSRYVDWIGFDPYNFFSCNGSGWNTFEEEIAPPHDFFVDQGLGDKPQILMEYGTEYDEANPALSVGWYRDIPTVLQDYTRIKALVRFDANSVSRTCNVSLSNGPGMLEAFAAAGRHPWVNTASDD